VRAIRNGVTRSGDVDIAYSVEGEGEATVLLIMGLGGRAADWGRTFIGALGRRHRVVRFDHRGVGQSPKAPAGYTLRDLAGDAVAVLDAVGAARAHVVGISMGGMIAQILAVEHAARVDHLVLMATHFGGKEVVPPHPEAMRLFDPVEIGRRDPEAQLRLTFEVITAPSFAERSPEVFSEILANVRAAPTPASSFYAQLQAILESDRSDLVRRITQRTLVIHGSEDKLIPPANGTRLTERIKGANFMLFQDCGHMPPWEKPKALSRLVDSFLR